MTATAPERLVRTRGLWHHDEVFRLVATGTASALLLLFAYIGASGTAHLDQQGLWLDLAIGGLLLGGFGATSFLLAGFRRVYLDVGGLLEAGRTPAAPAAFSAGAPLVSVAGTTRFHRASCLLVDGKAAVPGSREEHLQAGRTSCEMCRP